MDNWVIIAISVLVAIRICLHFVDKSRIDRASKDNGWRDINIKWSPFAPGWFFEKGERHYRVAFTDEQGQQRERTCKTSIFTGVFWRDPHS